MKRFKMAHGLVGTTGEPVRAPLKIVNNEVTEWGETTADIFLFILSNGPVVTQNDAIQGARLITAMETAKKNGAKFLEMEDGVHDWFKPMAEKMTPQLFRYSGNTVYNFILEGFEKSHEEDKKK